jgi:hypothetical protein
VSGGYNMCLKNEKSTLLGISLVFPNIKVTKSSYSSKRTCEIKEPKLFIEMKQGKKLPSTCLFPLLAFYLKE